MLNASHPLSTFAKRKVGPETALVSQEFKDMKELNKELLAKDEEVDRKIAALPKYRSKLATSATDPFLHSKLWKSYLENDSKFFNVSDQNYTKETC